MDKSEADFRKQLEAIFSERIQPGEAISDQPASANGAGCFHSYKNFSQRVQQCIARAANSEQVTLLLLIQLADSNDALSYKAGRLAGSCLRTGDAVCLLGGGRMAILAEGMRSSCDAPRVARKIHASLLDPFSVQRGFGSAPAWSGASVFPLDAMDYDYLWLRAESALQSALESSPGTCCFSELVTGRAEMERFDLIKDSYHAYRNKEFLMVYQPIFGMDGERVTGVEALLRWEHPRHGLLYPDRFMDLLEDSGLIVPLGEWIISEACRVAKKLSDKRGAPIRVCVNVSARQLTDPGFLLAVLDGLYDADINADLLQLEISEQVLAHDPKVVQKILVELGNAGVRIAIDQFGVGKSSLNELMRLPVTLIKIDRSLVLELSDNAVSKAITSGALAMANGAGMTVAAVGIEDNDQMHILGEMGCSEVQGSFLSHPHAAGDLLRWLPA